jgi:hypothetical protein
MNSLSTIFGILVFVLIADKEMASLFPIPVTHCRHFRADLGYWFQPLPIIPRITIRRQPPAAWRRIESSALGMLSMPATLPFSYKPRRPSPTNSSD